MFEMFIFSSARELYERVWTVVVEVVEVEEEVEVQGSYPLHK